MSLVLHVDGDRWRNHLRETHAASPGLVPVAKGNGYGLSVGRLARRAQWLGVDTLAVGTYPELPEVVQRFDGDLLVLTPWRATDPPLAAAAERVVHTVSRGDDLVVLLERNPRARFVLERATSMLRHGMTARELWDAARVVRSTRGARCEGVALHLPLGRGGNLAEAERLLTEVVGADLPGAARRTVYVSHLSRAELGTLTQRWPDLVVRPRIGTSLWLGDRDALRVSAEVLDAHELPRGTAFGYRGRSFARSGHLLVVSGGTAHGIGLEAPTGDLGARGRAATLARGGLGALGLVRSPFFVDGAQRLFAEPPHMQASMLFVPAGDRVPAVGDRVDVRVRYTTTTADRVEID
ncbi:alanine racemase [Nocardioides acrostichi]|uniref:Alanine racemase n=1 Tax=Nocardioides acrostichi TaxID=2784339 RepID=A0A930V544_9ACTN|nr:alanine racemase [Nocardioides acrostichi]MBF4163920.1 alanine racemase [Nocardioides acrostichi]